MRFLLIVGAIALSICGSGAAQNSKGFRVKPTSPEVKGEHKSMPAEKIPAPSKATSRDLKDLERQTAKTKPIHRTQTQTRKQSVALKPQKQRANPPINFGKSQTKVGGVDQGSNPYKGRLRQKHGGR